MPKPRQYKKQTLHKMFSSNEEQWNALVRERAGELDLSGSVFHGVSFERRYSKKVNFDNCQFYNCSFSSVGFFDCSFRQASFLDCTMGYVDFANSNMFRTGISNLRSGDNTSFYLADLSHAVIVDSKFLESVFIKTNLQSAVLKRCKLISCAMSEADFSDAVLIEVNFSECEDLDTVKSLSPSAILDQSIENVLDAIRSSKG